jgi:hypothetical protein
MFSIAQIDNEFAVMNSRDRVIAYFATYSEAEEFMNLQLDEAYGLQLS